MTFGLDNFHSRYVYRVLRPDENKNVYLTCKDASSTRSLAIHVETGLWIPLKYISTARTLDNAKFGSKQLIRLRTHTKIKGPQL